MSELRQALRNTSVKGWSSPATLRVVADLVSGLDWSRAKVCDVGAGRGDFTRMLGEALKGTLGLNPADHVFACDLMPESYGYDAVPCRATGADGRLPFDDDEFDVVISVEVIEHVENQFEFMRELARVTKPGGQVIVTTPNTLNANSRIRTLLWGFPGLYDPLPIGNKDPRRLAGHIHPISPYYLAYSALRAGLGEPRFHVDRTKRSAVALAALLLPVMIPSNWLTQYRLARKHPELVRENRSLIDAQGGWNLLTCRTAVLQVTKPA